MISTTHLLTFGRRQSLVHGQRPGLAWRRLCNQLRLMRRWWLKAHEPYQPFFVIASGRSGSNLLLSYLNQAPEVRALSEVLSPQLAIGPSQYAVTPAQAIKHIRYSLQAQKRPLRGAKLMLGQMETNRLSLNKLNAAFPEAKYIILYRQALAEQFVSQQTALVTKQYLVFHGQERKRAPITVDPGRLRSFCDHMRASYRDAISHSWLAGRAVLLSYEELTAEPEHWLHRHVCPLLGIGPIPAKTHLQKQATEPLAERITNYHQVATLLHSPLCRQQHAWPWERQGKRRAA